MQAAVLKGLVADTAMIYLGDIAAAIRCSCTYVVQIYHCCMPHQAFDLSSPHLCIEAVAILSPGDVVACIHIAEFAGCYVQRLGVGYCNGVPRLYHCCQLLRMHLYRQSKVYLVNHCCVPQNLLISDLQPSVKVDDAKLSPNKTTAAAVYAHITVMIHCCSIRRQLLILTLPAPYQKDHSFSHFCNENTATLSRLTSTSLMHIQCMLLIKALVWSAAMQYLDDTYATRWMQQYHLGIHQQRPTTTL